MNEPIRTGKLDFYPLTSERWDDFVRLFGANGAYGGCWCMYWRISRKEFGQNGDTMNKQAMKDLIDSGVIPGIIGYLDGQPAAWCSIAPREDFASLERSRNLKRVDDKPVWAIVCFFTTKSARNKGLMEETIRAAVAYASQNGAQIVEAYPVEVDGHQPPGELYMGNHSTFLKAGFVKVETRGKHQYMRWSREK